MASTGNPPSNKLARKCAILDETTCDGRPVIHTLLATCAKAPDGPAIALIALDRPVSDHSCWSTTRDLDLNLAAIQNRFHALDSIGLSIGPKFWTMDPMDDPQMVLEKMVDFVTSFKRTITDSKGPLLVIIDGISTLCTLGWPLGKVISLIKTIEQQCDRLCVRANRQVTEGQRLAL